ncbi:MAG: malonic semialdehyde reductase [Blastococcus sp.]|nr:malonic semialdehyde reductase [Blastococcus sp.]
MEYRLEGLPPLQELDPDGRELLFKGGRTVYAFDGRPVPVETLQSIWELARWGPTSANSQPLRVVFVSSPEGRQRLADTVNRGNRGKVLSAGATALLATDDRFHEHMPTVMPLRPDFRELWEEDVETRSEIGRLSAALQAGYLILAVRAHGLAAGPFSGFDPDEITAEFMPDTGWRAFMGINIGYPASEAALPRLPRMDVDDVVRWA